MLQHILPTDTQPLGMGSIGQNSTFSEHGHVAYQIKWNHEMQQHGSKYFARRPPMPLTHSIGQKSTFSEHCHVASQRMQQHGSKYFACRPPFPQDPRVWGPKSKIQFFQIMVMLHFKLKGIMNAATW